VLPIFVDVQKFASVPKKPVAGNLLWIGRFAPEKQPEIAIKALRLARENGMHVHLTMLGSGPLEGSLRALAQEYGVAEAVSFPGWRDPVEYLQSAELLLSTSAYEGYGMAIVEGLASSVPVLSFDVGVAREAGARIVEGEFSEALLNWLSGPRARGVLTLATYKDENDYFTQTHTFYKKMILDRVAGDT
jgi:glycosyltransferase involved in cell wall biosynthesis